MVFPQLHSTSRYFPWVICIRSFWCPTLPEENEERGCFLFHAGVNLGSNSAPSVGQAQTRDQGGAYEVVSASFLNGDLWNPAKRLDSKVGFLICFFLDFDGWSFKITFPAFMLFHSSFVFILIAHFVLIKWNFYSHEHEIQTNFDVSVPMSGIICMCRKLFFTHIPGITYPDTHFCVLLFFLESWVFFCIRV